MEKLVSDIFQGAYKSRFKGRGIEFEEVREYTPGDDIRTIDWNVSARMNAPYVKNFREERELTVMLAVDISASCLYGTNERTKKEVIAEIGALLAFSAIKNNDKIGLILFTDKIELYIPARKGVRHVQRIIRELLVNKPASSKTSLKEALAFMGKVLTRSAICFLISDFISPHYENELKTTAKKHDLIAVRVYDETEMSFPQLKLMELTDFESGMTKLIDTSSSHIQKFFKESSQKRAEFTKKLMTLSGAGYIDINCKSDYFKSFQSYFLKKKHRR